MSTQNSMFDQIRNNDHLDADKCNLFYDWFCSDGSLERRAAPLMALVKKICFSQMFDAREVYVFFKNNCPMDGPTYDSFSICDRHSGDVLFHIAKRNGDVILHSRGNDFEEPIVTGSTKHVVDWFMS